MKASRGFACIGLQQPKTEANVGGAFRAAHCYGAALIAICGSRYKRVSTDTTKAFKHIPLIETEDLHLVIPRDCVPIAVDLIPGATSLHEFVHPERAFYIFGPEDGTLGQSITSWCKHTIYVPTTYCMNLAATVNVVLYDRQAKELRK